MTVRTALPLTDAPGFAEAFASVVAAAEGLVCSVCGLERMGHGPESGWLGYSAHAWDGVPTDAAGLVRASDLTVRAYSMRPAPWGHRFRSYRCATNCAHTDGHCETCR